MKIVENGITYEVDFAQGHKTGFFCDQRDNRLKFASLVKGGTVLDLCCYSGGFSIAAKMLGGAAEVTAVDLDEKAVAMARRNANINQQRIEFVHADAFVYARQMVRNGRLFDAVLLDPPKFIIGRDGFEEGIKKYHDLNMLGLSASGRAASSSPAPAPGCFPPTNLSRPSSKRPSGRGASSRSWA